MCIRDSAFTDQPERVIVAEIVREKILRNTAQEIPHGTAVVVEKFAEREGKKDLVDIDCTLYCERPNHKMCIRDSTSRITIPHICV